MNLMAWHDRRPSMPVKGRQVALHSPSGGLVTERPSMPRQCSSRAPALALHCPSREGRGSVEMKRSASEEYFWLSFVFEATFRLFSDRVFMN